MNSSHPDIRVSRARRRSWIGLALLGMVVIGSALLVYSNGIQHSIEWLAGREETFDQILQQRPVITYLALFLLYVVVTAASVPGATLLSLLMAMLLGFWPALVLVSFASTLGATLAMLLARTLFRESVELKLSGRYRRFFQGLKEDGPYYLFALRLSPYVPYFVVNLLMGLTSMRTWTFWWISQLGMLPMTCLYLWAGSELPGFRQLSEKGPGELVSPMLGLALVLVAVVPLLIRLLVKRRPGVEKAAG
jgi:uncharacterized membrane protein YdjX (TVP38/TMEM64 family)